MPEEMGGIATAKPETYTAVPLGGLVTTENLPFALYLRTADNSWVLYRPPEALIDEGHIGRLRSEGVANLFIQDADRGAYFKRVENSLDTVLLDDSVTLDHRADLLYGVANMVTDDLLSAQPDKENLSRARKMMMSASGLLLRENQGFHAVRRVLEVSPDLAHHSLTVGFLSMGLSRLILGGDAGTIAMAGLGGLLHDVGKIGHEDIEHDPEHTTRGAAYLRSLDVPAPVVECAASHHECHDGSGFPAGKRGHEIPELARIVGLVNIFDKVYGSQEPRVGVFDALRILAQAYKGCFDERLAQGLVKLFR